MYVKASSSEVGIFHQPRLIQNISSEEEHFMNTTTFLILLSVFSALSSLVTECVKDLIFDKANLPYNLIALGCACVIGSAGTAVYYRLTAAPFTADRILCMILMGLASGLTAMVGFDKIKQALKQINETKG